MRKPLYMIVARASNGVIGKDGALPWTLRVDHRHFLDQTKGDCIIIGRRTYEEQGQAIPGRCTVVVSRSLPRPYPDAQLARSLPAAIELAQRLPCPRVWIAGGTMLYLEGMRYASRLLLTDIRFPFNGDTFLPDVWRESFPFLADRQTLCNGAFVYHICDLRKDPAGCGGV